MLTAFQCEVVAFMTDGGIICVDCAHKTLDSEGGEAVADCTPMIRYSVDEYDSASSEDIEHESAPDCGCTYGVYCEDCGKVIVEPFDDTYAHEQAAES